MESNCDLTGNLTGSLKKERKKEIYLRVMYKVNQMTIITLLFALIGLLRCISRIPGTQQVSCNPIAWAGQRGGLPSPSVLADAFSSSVYCLPALCTRYR